MKYRVRSNSGSRMVQELGFIDPGTAANIASGVASLFQIGRGGVAGYDGGLGFLDPASVMALVTTFDKMTGGSGAPTPNLALFQRLLGGGANAARQAMEGEQVAHFPPGTSFQKYLDMTMPFRGQTKTHREIYNIKKKDNWMLSRRIGSEKDYGAYVALWMLANGHIDPNVKDPNSSLYKNAPVYASNKINIFDLARLQAYYKKDEIKAKIAEVSAQENAFKAEILKIESTLPAANERIRQWNASLNEVTKDVNRFCASSYPGGPYPNYERDPAKCQIERTRYETFVANNPPPPDSGALARQLRDLQTQLANVAGIKSALQNELNQSAQLPSFAANVPGAYQFEPGFYADDIEPFPGEPKPYPGEPKPLPTTSPVAPPSFPSWLLPAIGGGALLLLSQRKGRK
jgi:hypothetical protein